VVVEIHGCGGATGFSDCPTGYNKALYLRARNNITYINSQAKEELHVLIIKKNKNKNYSTSQASSNLSASSKYSLAN
jgi:hypothetical protein